MTVKPDTAVHAKAEDAEVQQAIDLLLTALDAAHVPHGKVEPWSDAFKILPQECPWADGTRTVCAEMPSSVCSPAPNISSSACTAIAPIKRGRNFARILNNALVAS